MAELTFRERSLDANLRARGWAPASLGIYKRRFRVSARPDLWLEHFISPTLVGDAVGGWRAGLAHELRTVRRRLAALPRIVR